MDDAFLGIGIPTLLLLIIGWLIAGAVAALIAHKRGVNPIVFFLVTAFFLGPLGPGFALVAQADADPEPAKRKVADGRRRFACPRCGAENDIPNEDASYNCWRCDEHRKVRPVKAVVDVPADPAE